MGVKVEDFSTLLLASQAITVFNATFNKNSGLIAWGQFCRVILGVMPVIG